MGQRDSFNKKTPAELVTRAQKREPLSARVKTDTKRILTRAAKEAKSSLSDLSAAILDDYAEWLDLQNKGKKND